MTRSPDKDKENFVPGSDLKLEKMGQKEELEKAVKAVKEVMSEEERGMTVEEWVRWGAGRAEELVRRECEEMVMGFEREGMRALRVLEGIETLR